MASAWMPKTPRIKGKKPALTSHLLDGFAARDRMATALGNSYRLGSGSMCMTVSADQQLPDRPRSHTDPENQANPVNQS
jgi:hypothetical protein